MAARFAIFRTPADPSPTPDSLHHSAGIRLVCADSLATGHRVVTARSRLSVHPNEELADSPPLCWMQLRANPCSTVPQRKIRHTDVECLNSLGRGAVYGEAHVLGHRFREFHGPPDDGGIEHVR